MLILNCSGINADGDVSDQSLSEVIIIHRNHRDDWVITIRFTLGELHIDIVLGAVDLRMRGIWLESHNLLLEFLLEIQLPSAHGVFEDESAILLSGPVCMDLDMNVDSPFDVKSYCRVSERSQK